MASIMLFEQRTVLDVDPVVFFHHTTQKEKVLLPPPRSTVILQIFSVVLFSVFSVVKGFTEIKKTRKGH